jgi:hypothetical protein
LQGNGRYGLRYDEDHVKILGVEKPGSTVLQPLSASQRLALWAMAIPTTIITNPLPAQIADIAYHNKAVIYDILF